MNSSAMGYASSIISFLAAVCAGAASARHNNAGGIASGLVSAVVLIVLLLTIGFLVTGSNMEAAAIISVVSFSISGCTFGAVFLGKKSSTKRKVKSLKLKR